MAYTAQELITEAYYLSNIVSRGLETVSAEQLTDGLKRLNGLLSIKTANMGLIPYYREYVFNAVVGQEKYYIPNLIEAETLTFNIGPVRYSVIPTTRQNYFATSRVDNINSLPYQWHIERRNDGADLYLYFRPSDTINPLKLWGKFGLNKIESFRQDLLVEDQPFFVEYLLYGLAEYLCEYYNVTFSDVQRARLRQYEYIIRDISPLDLTQRKLSCFTDGPAFNYGDASVGKGWRPPSSG